MNLIKAMNQIEPLRISMCRILNFKFGTTAVERAAGQTKRKRKKNHFHHWRQWCSGFFFIPSLAYVFSCNTTTRLAPYEAATLGSSCASNKCKTLHIHLYNLLSLSLLSPPCKNETRRRKKSHLVVLFSFFHTGSDDDAFTVHSSTSNITANNVSTRNSHRTTRVGTSVFV